jgi:hypothetical protein
LPQDTAADPRAIRKEALIFREKHNSDRVHIFQAMRGPKMVHLYSGCWVRRQADKHNARLANWRSGRRVR